MGMSTHLVGIRDPDERWSQMKTIWDACKAAKVSVPEEVREFFAGVPDPDGIVIDLSNPFDVAAPAREWVDPDPRASRQGLEINVSDIPPQVTVLRFYNSW